MKHLIFVLIFAFPGLQQNDLTQTLSEANIKVDLPNKAWSLADKKDQNDMTVYIYKRQPVEDGEGRKIIPNIAVIIENVDAGLDPVSYSLQKRTRTGFEVLEVFAPGSGKLRFRNAIAYKGRYVDKSGLEHTIYVIHGINGSKGLQVICDTTTSVLETLEKEFLDTMISLRT